MHHCSPLDSENWTIVYFPGDTPLDELMKEVSTLNHSSVLGVRNVNIMKEKLNTVKFVLCGIEFHHETVKYTFL